MPYKQSHALTYIIQSAFLTAQFVAFDRVDSSLGRKAASSPMGAASFLLRDRLFLCGTPVLASLLKVCMMRILRLVTLKTTRGKKSEHLFHLFGISSRSVGHDARRGAGKLHHLDGKRSRIITGVGVYSVRVIRANPCIIKLKSRVVGKEWMSSRRG